MKDNKVNIFIRNKDESVEHITLKEKVVLSACLATLIAMKDEIETKGRAAIQHGLLEDDKDMKQMFEVAEMIEEITNYTWQRIELLDEISVFPINNND